MQVAAAARPQCGGSERQNLIGRLDEAFAEQEACGQFGVVTGGAHGDGQRAVAEANLEWLFGGQRVLLAGGDAVIPFRDLGEDEALRRQRVGCGLRLEIAGRYGDGSGYGGLRNTG